MPESVKSFIKSWKFMAIIAAVLTAVVVGLLIFGIGTHAEPGFDESWPQWSREDMPLVVCAHSYDEPEDGDELLHTQESRNANILAGMVSQTINERLGFEAFAGPEGPCDVLIVTGVPAEAGFTDPGGNAQVVGDPPVCRVEIVNTGTSELSELVLQHELGHCLGLAHDDYELSIMRRVQSPTPDRAFPPRISDSDRELLRARYGAQ